MMVIFLISGMLGACSTQAPIPVTITPEPSIEALVFTPIATVAVPTQTATLTPSPTLTSVPPTETISTTPTSEPTALPSQTATIFAEDATETVVMQMVADYVDHYRMQRPIEQIEGKTHWVDRTYPYGSTQFGTREEHLGVEFVNPRFTPVLAVADGMVIYAGMDTETQFGPATGYYGNLIVIQHNFLSAEGLPIFSLYGHLQDIAVNTGEQVSASETIGRIGDSGIALGPHLHFEVRFGDATNYLNTLNPELWIMPYRGYGTVAGFVNSDQDVSGMALQIRGSINRETYVYGNERVNPDASWGENFVLGDLPIGNYELIISTDTGRILFRQSFTISEGRTTWIDVNLNDGGSS